VNGAAGSSKLVDHKATRAAPCGQDLGVPTVKSLIKILTQCFASQIKVRSVSFGGFE
jgi:hypothetical protein